MFWIPACAGMTGFNKQLYRQVYLDTESKRRENARHAYHPLHRIYRFPRMGRTRHRQYERHHRAPALDGPALQMARQRRRGSVCRDGRRSRYALPRKRRRTHRSVEKRRHLLRRNRHGTRRPSVRRSADFGDRERRQCLRSSEKRVSGCNGIVGWSKKR